MVTARTPSPIDAVLPEYIYLHESTGETYKSIADRVESQGGAAPLVEALRKFDSDSEAYKVNVEINKAAEQRKRDAAERQQTALDPASQAQRDTELAELRARLEALEARNAGDAGADPTTSPDGGTGAAPKGRGGAPRQTT